MSDLTVTFLASFLVWFLLMGLFVLWVVDGRIKREQVLHAIFAVFLTWIVSEMIKSLLSTTRPFVVEQVSPTTLTIPKGGAFPSIHAGVAFAIATSIILHSRKIGFFFVLGAILVAVGRVLAEVHYPVDVLFGAILGVFTAALISRIHLFDLLRKK